MKKVDFEKVVYELARDANTVLRQDVLRLIKRAYLSEKAKGPKSALGVILENAKDAVAKKYAICQDTGLPIVFLEVGRDIEVDFCVITSINRGIIKAYKKEGFRASTIEPFSDRIGINPEIIHLEFVKRRGLKITVFPKGFGSENKSRLKMFNPTVCQEDIFRFVVEAVKDAGPGACPPFFVGVGIGGTSDGALLLAKKALLERVDKPNKSLLMCRWEKELLKRINSLKIGPMGMGGRFTALAVKIKRGPTHIAGLPVGINISCHALRSASIHIRVERLADSG
ncbi:MAG: fumarate hydratase [Candidatus Omnitrophota bacterium]